MKTTILQTKDFFKSINAPTTLGVNYIANEGMKYPSRLRFNTTYYMFKDEKLVAFRILAYAYKRRQYSHLVLEGLSYLVQMPNEEPRWIDDFLTEKTRIFNSPEEFMKHQTGYDFAVELNWEKGKQVFPNLGYAAVIGLKGMVWQWSETHNSPTDNFSPEFDYFVVCADGLFVGISKQDYYLSAEECVKGKLNGLEIVDFAEEPVKITINVLPNTPKIHTLRFIEE